jgi:hypothetical protein
MNSGRDPLIIVVTAFDNCPYISLIETANKLKIFTECFKSKTTPNIETGFRVAIWIEESIKSIFMKNKWSKWCLSRYHAF